MRTSAQNEINGSVVAEIIQNNVTEQHFTFSGPIQLLFQAAGLPGDKLFFAANEAFVNGLLTARLNGALIGKIWGAH